VNEKLFEPRMNNSLTLAIQQSSNFTHNYV
jgi:hypothetical protein